MSDAYCKGIVRGQVECCNLRANHKLGQTVAAERIATTGFIAFPGYAYIAAVKRFYGEGVERPQARKYVKTKATGSGARHLREIDIVQAYGNRPFGTACWWLSPYEFTMYWALVPARAPQTLREWEDEDPATWDVTLTASGQQRLQKHDRAKLAKLRPQRDFKIRLANTSDRCLFPATAGNATLRHAWYLQRRMRPLCPHFAQAAVPRRFVDNVEDNAMQCWRESTLGRERWTRRVALRPYPTSVIYAKLARPGKQPYVDGPSVYRAKKVSGTLGTFCQFTASDHRPRHIVTTAMWTKRWNYLWMTSQPRSKRQNPTKPTKPNRARR